MKEITVIKRDVNGAMYYTIDGYSNLTTVRGIINEIGKIANKYSSTHGLHANNKKEATELIEMSKCNISKLYDLTTPNRLDYHWGVELENLDDRYYVCARFFEC